MTRGVKKPLKTQFSNPAMKLTNREIGIGRAVRSQGQLKGKCGTVKLPEKDTADLFVE